MGVTVSLLRSKGIVYLNHPRLQYRLLNFWREKGVSLIGFFSIFAYVALTSSGVQPVRRDFLSFLRGSSKCPIDIPKIVRKE